MDKGVRAGKADHHFIRVARPRRLHRRRRTVSPVNAGIRAARTAALYSVDEAKTLRQSHKNPDIAAHEKWLGNRSRERRTTFSTRFTTRSRES